MLPGRRATVSTPSGQLTTTATILQPHRRSSGTSRGVEGLEPTFGQDLNGDGVIGRHQTGAPDRWDDQPHACRRSNVLSVDTSTGSGPSLKFGGADVIAVWRPWHPSGRCRRPPATTLPGRQATVSLRLGTDNNGNYVSNLIAVAPATSPVLEGLETTFGQDLNGDGVTGINVTKQLIQTDGSTSLALVGGQNYYLFNSTTGSGPSLKWRCRRDRQSVESLGTNWGGTDGERLRRRLENEHRSVLCVGD